MQRILILEDDTLQRQGLVKMICDQYPEWQIEAAATYQDACTALEQPEDFTIFFIDIELDNPTDSRTGFDFASHLRAMPQYERTPILFITGISDQVLYALSHFHCYTYIIKPYTKEDIYSQLQSLMSSAFCIEQPIYFKDWYGISHTVMPSSILYAEADGHIITLHTTSHDAIRFRQTNMSTFLDSCHGLLCRCHRKYAVNPNHIEKYDKSGHLLYIRDTAIPVGRTYKALFTQY